MYDSLTHDIYNEHENHYNPYSAVIHPHYMSLEGNRGCKLSIFNPNAITINYLCTAKTYFNENFTTGNEMQIVHYA